MRLIIKYIVILKGLYYIEIVNRKKNSMEDIEIRKFLLKKGYTSDNIKLAMSY